VGEGNPHETAIPFAKQRLTVNANSPRRAIRAKLFNRNNLHKNKLGRQHCRSRLPAAFERADGNLSETVDLDSNACGIYTCGSLTPRQSVPFGSRFACLKGVET